MNEQDIIVSNEYLKAILILQNLKHQFRCRSHHTAKELEHNIVSDEEKEFNAHSRLRGAQNDEANIILCIVMTIMISVYVVFGGCVYEYV
jgi:hypothetical protein